MWTWNSDPSGTDAANPNPAGAGAFAYNLRLLGQAIPNPELLPDKTPPRAPTLKPRRTSSRPESRFVIRGFCGGAR
jgi:hypothetical protein